jgi:hypothetical protein
MNMSEITHVQEIFAVWSNTDLEEGRGINHVGLFERIASMSGPGLANAKA